MPGIRDRSLTLPWMHLLRAVCDPLMFLSTYRGFHIVIVLCVYLCTRPYRTVCSGGSYVLRVSIRAGKMSVIFSLSEINRAKKGDNRQHMFDTYESDMKPNKERRLLFYGIHFFEESNQDSIILRGKKISDNEQIDFVMLVTTATNTRRTRRQTVQKLQFQKIIFQLFFTDYYFLNS